MEIATKSLNVSPAKRRWWLALLLFILYGVGYLYVGKPKRYIAYLLFYVLVSATFFLAPSKWLSEPMVFVGFLGAVAAVTIGMAIDVIWLAIKQKSFQPRWYNRWWAYVGSILLGVSLSFIPDLMGGRSAQAVRIFSIPAASNSPTLQVGDYIIADNKAYEQDDPLRGDVVVFKLPRDNSIDYIKRVIGLPGDEIEMRNGVLFINGKEIPKRRTGSFVTRRRGGPPRKIPAFEETLPNGVKYTVLDADENGDLDNVGPYKVPEGHYFMMGDNRDNSTDSRATWGVGYVPRKNIFARASWISYSRDLNRIGKRIK